MGETAIQIQVFQQAVPFYVAGMVIELACGDEKQTWTLRDLRYDWAALEDLPVADGSMDEVWTRAWIRRGKMENSA